jgi:uncharacterized protein Usg
MLPDLMILRFIVVWYAFDCISSGPRKLTFLIQMKKKMKKPLSSSVDRHERLLNR